MTVCTCVRNVITSFKSIGNVCVLGLSLCLGNLFLVLICSCPGYIFDIVWVESICLRDNVVIAE